MTSGPAVIGLDGQFDDAALVGEYLCLARHEEGFWIVRVPVRA